MDMAACCICVCVLYTYTVDDVSQLISEDFAIVFLQLSFANETSRRFDSCLVVQVDAKF